MPHSTALTFYCQTRRFPAGMTTHLLPNAPYANPVGAEIHAWRPHHWYTWMWRVGQASFSYKAHATPSIHHPNATRVRSNAHGPDATSAGGDAARPHLHGDIGHDPMSTTAWKSAPSADQAMKLAGRAALRSKSESLKPQVRFMASMPPIAGLFPIPPPRLATISHAFPFTLP